MEATETPDDRYETIEGHLERDRDTVIGLWRGNIGWQDQLDRMYDVFYLDCPYQKPLLRLLRHRASHEIVGTVGMGARAVLWRGNELVVGCASHFVVRREHRSLKPAVALLRSLLEASLQHFPFVYGMTNDRGGAVCKRADLAVPTQLQRHVKPLRYRDYATRLLPGPLGRLSGRLLDGALAAGRQLGTPLRRTGLHAHWSDTIDARMQQMWERSERGDGFSTVRTTSMLRWRFLDLPAIDRRFLLVAPAPGAPLLAWFVCETNVRTPRFMTVTDAWFAGGAHCADRRAIRELCRMGYAAGYDAIEMRLTAASAAIDAWRAEGFRTRGQQPFFVHGLDQASTDDLGATAHITDIEQDG
ncbi:MAG: hypothetical protein WBA65_09335 [Rhodanobacter sp.]